jgi:hypothetical protein
MAGSTIRWLAISTFEKLRVLLCKWTWPKNSIAPAGTERYERSANRD